ncbi:MAG: hypothetical protein KTR25_07620 [Myxococcales bacterium]|nr:hypothetical protein [Myxococcales bacterium]
MTSLTSLATLDPAIAATNEVQNTTSQELVNAEQFLQLLVAQLENQNPLEPLDGTDYVSQLAEFASLEQLTQVNTGLGDINSGQAGLLSQNSIMMLDRHVTFPGNEIVLGDNNRADINYRLNSSAGDVVISILNSSGVKVGEIANAPRAAGLNEFDWDGTVEFEGEEIVLEPGVYSYSITAMDGNNPVGSETFGSGLVTGVTYENGYPELILRDKRIVPGVILKVTEKSRL